MAIDGTEIHMSVDERRRIYRELMTYSQVIKAELKAGSVVVLAFFQDSDGYDVIAGGKAPYEPRQLFKALSELPPECASIEGAKLDG